MLGNCGEPLIQEILEAAMVSSNDERTCPQIWTPMPHSLHKTNQFTFICSKFSMARSDSLAEESNEAVKLVKDDTKAGTGGVAVHHKFFGEIGQLKNWPRGERPLQIVEGVSGRLSP